MKIRLALAFSEPVRRRASWTALIVGAILTLINHGTAILRGGMDLPRLIQICLTVTVPYVVSTASSVSTLLSMEGRIRQNETVVVRTD